jgi:hypothetical protein
MAFTLPPDTLKNSSALAFAEEDIIAATHYLETLSQLFPFKVLSNLARFSGSMPAIISLWPSLHASNNLPHR